MAFKPGVSGNPAGRPKKLLRRVDEVLSEAGVEPVAEVLAIVAAMKRRHRRAKADAKAAIEGQMVKIWLELLPYVHPRRREEAEGDLPEPERAPLRRLSTEELRALIGKPLEQKAAS